MSTWSVCPICDGFGNGPLSGVSELEAVQTTLPQPKDPVAARRFVMPDVDEPPRTTFASAHSDVEQAFVLGVMMLAGVSSTFMAIGTVAEFDQGHIGLALLLGTGAAAPLAGVVALAVDGWQRGRPRRSG